MEFHSMRDCNAWLKQQLPMNTTSNECCKLYDAALTQYVKWYESAAFGGLDKTLENMLNCDPNFILGHCLISGLELIGASSKPNDFNNQTKFAEFNNLVKKTKGLTERELNHAKAIKYLYCGDIVKACDLWEWILLKHPTDMLALKFAHDCYFYLGFQSQMRDSVARVLPHWGSSIPLYSSLYSIYSFGLIQSGQSENARIAATKSLEMDRFDAWGTHTLCHYYEYSTEYDKDFISKRVGIEFLSKTEPDWSVCNLLSSHNYWHWALYHIEKGEHESAMDIFKTSIKVNTALNRTLDMVDSISLLYRLKLDGCELPLQEEWNELAEAYVSRREDHGYVFNDSHVAMLLCESNRLADEDLFFSSLNKYLGADDHDGEVDGGRETEAPNACNFLRELNGAYAERICRAIFSFRDNDFAGVVDQLYPIRYELVRVGGSHAQRDLFQQLLIQSALRSDLEVHKKLGVALLEERRALKPHAKLTERIAARFALIN